MKEGTNTISASKRLRAVVFDFDGTLADTLPVCFAAFRYAFQKHINRHFTNEQIEALFGPSEPGAIRRVIPEGWQPVYQTYLDAYEDSHSLCSAPFPGIPEVLAWLKDKGICVGVVTGKGADSAAISFSRLGFNNLFDGVETGNPEGAQKPAAIRRMLAEWSVAAAEAAYVGDVVQDMKDAREVGVLPLAAAWAGTARVAELEAADPKALFRSVQELRLWLESQLERFDNSD